MAVEKEFQEWCAVCWFVDGDTFYGCLDHGGGIFRGRGIDMIDLGSPKPRIVLESLRQRCALIQAIEKNAPRGAEAKAFAESLAPPGIYPCITYKSDDNFDRPLIDIILPARGFQRFSTLMLQSGYAVPYKG